LDSLSSLSVGNGNFAFTVDVTGLQTFPELYRQGVPLGTQSQWGWHSFPNVRQYAIEESYQVFDFGHGHPGAYSTVAAEKGRQQDAANFFRTNPHRLHLGIVGFEMTDRSQKEVSPDEISSVKQNLDLWTGMISSRFVVNNQSVSTQTVCDPDRDMIAAKISSPLFTEGLLKIRIRFPYPTGAAADDACDWSAVAKHQTEIVSEGDGFALFKRILDNTNYYVRLDWAGKAHLDKKEEHYFLLTPESQDFSFSVSFSEGLPDPPVSGFEQTAQKTGAYWQNYWETGGAIDFSRCKDIRAKELERRIVLSQYLTAIQCAGTLPPQETGLTYNSWQGKFHLEMHWWHAVHFALWNRLDLMERSLDWYAAVEPVAKEIAERQGFSGIRWMKATDPSGVETPSTIGPFLIWQQPHFIYMAELIYRQKPSREVLDKYKHLVFETAEFMASFATLDTADNRYVLKGVIPAQETLRPKETVNPPFELSYWHYALSVAQQWRERTGLTRDTQWDAVIEKLSPLASKDGLYLAAESAPQTYRDVRFTSDHPSVLGAFGILPLCRLVETATMQNTLDWVCANWNWDHTWGWDYPMTAMSATRLGKPDKAVDILLMNQRTNTYLTNGHNYQNQTLRIYLPGNGGLLTAAAMMCAGWDGNTTPTPGFPKDGQWDVRWEGLLQMP
jgi:hypothetical protein